MPSKHLQPSECLGNPDKQNDKVFNIDKTCESYLAKYKCIKLCVYCLRLKEDEELIQILKDKGYNYNSVEDLDQIERECEALISKVKKQKAKLPKQKENDKKTPFDEMVIQCATITGAGFIDTNKITKTQLDGLINVTLNKIKAAEQHGKG